MHLGLCSTATEALDLFGARRCSDSAGVTIPSQIRYVHHYEKVLASTGGGGGGAAVMANAAVKGGRGGAIDWARHRRLQKVTVHTWKREPPKEGDMCLEIFTESRTLIYTSKGAAGTPPCKVVKLESTGYLDLEFESVPTTTPPAFSFTATVPNQYPTSI